MRKYLIGVLFIIYIFFFGLFTISADVSPVFAADCLVNAWIPWGERVSPGSLQCENSAISSTISQCQSDGSWKEYYKCSNEVPPAGCEDFTTTTNNKSARCVGKVAPPTPTPTITPTPLPTLPASFKCSGGYSAGEEHCTADKKIEICTPQFTGGTVTSVSWQQKNPISENTCTLGPCVEQGSSPTRSAKCELNQPTATITPTPNGVTPTPDASVTCPDPDGGATPYKAGAKFCGEYDWGGSRTAVSQCQNDGTFKKIGYCSGAKAVTCQPQGAPDGDTCSTLIQPISESELSCTQSPKPAQQLIPQPGVNCGIPAEDLPEGANTAALACCYSSAADMKVMPLSCFIKLPGAEDFFNSLSDKINEIFDCLPNFTNCEDNRSKNVLDIKGVKDALKNMPPCMPGAKPKAVNTGGGVVSGETLNGTDEGGTPLCTCERMNTATSALCDNINTTDASGHVVPDTTEQAACRSCMLNADGSQGNGIWTALGCINITNENGIIQSLFRIGIGLAGAIALLCNMYAAFLFQTSRGNPEGIKKAQDLITSCIAGLLLIVFSVFILRLIGYNILRIPGFG